MAKTSVVQILYFFPQKASSTQHFVHNKTFFFVHSRCDGFKIFLDHPILKVRLSLFFFVGLWIFLCWLVDLSHSVMLISKVLIVETKLCLVVAH